MKVYLVTYAHDIDDIGVYNVAGVFASEKLAKEAVKKIERKVCQGRKWITAYIDEYEVIEE